MEACVIGNDVVLFEMVVVVAIMKGVCRLHQESRISVIRFIAVPYISKCCTDCSDEGMMQDGQPMHSMIML